MSKNAFTWSLVILALVILSLLSVIGKQSPEALANLPQQKTAPAVAPLAPVDLRLGLKYLAPMQVEKQFPGQCDNPAVQIIHDKDYVVVHCTFAKFGFGPAGNGYYLAWRMR